MRVELPYGIIQDDIHFKYAEIKGLTAKEHNLFFDPMHRATLMRDIIKACLISLSTLDDEVKHSNLPQAINDLPLEDRDVLLLNIRLATHRNPNYIFHAECPHCEQKQSFDVNLHESFPVEMPEDAKNREWEVDYEGFHLVFKMLTIRDETESLVEVHKNVRDKALSIKKKNPKISDAELEWECQQSMKEKLNFSTILKEQLCKFLVSIDGKKIETINDLDDLPIWMVNDIPKVLEESKPKGGCDINIKAKCMNCEKQFDTNIFGANGSASELEGVVHFFCSSPRKEK